MLKREFFKILSVSVGTVFLQTSRRISLSFSVASSILLQSRFGRLAAAVRVMYRHSRVQSSAGLPPRKARRSIGLLTPGKSGVQEMFKNVTLVCIPPLSRTDRTTFGEES